MIQIYGNFSGFASADRVSREILWECWRRRLPVSGVKGIDSSVNHLQVSYEDIPPTYRENVNNAAPIGLVYGTIEKAFMWLRGHKEKLLYAFCETDRVPNGWLPYLNAMTQVYVPSAFCKSAFEESGVKVPITVLRHGISDEFQLKPNSITKHPTTNILHVSGALSYPQRKGLPQVLLAFSQLAPKHPELRLWLQVHKTQILIDALEELKITAQTSILPFGSISDSRQAMVYRNAHLVLQPSRGEGFGMAPLEARACGTPVALTFAHGHLEHAQPNVDIPIAMGPLRHMVTQGNERGRAPEVSVEAVKQAVEEFLANRETYTKRAREWAFTEQKNRSWSWENVLRPLVVDIKRRLKADRQPVVFGEHVGVVGAEDA